jgi:hypothetical protein
VQRSNGFDTTIGYPGARNRSLKVFSSPSCAQVLRFQSRRIRPPSIVIRLSGFARSSLIAYQCTDRLVTTLSVNSGASRENHDPGSASSPLPANQGFDATDVLAIRLRKQSLDPRLFAQLHVRTRQGIVDAATLSVRLTGPGVEKRVPGRLRPLQPFVDVDAERRRQRVQAHAL